MQVCQVHHRHNGGTALFLKGDRWQWLDGLYGLNDLLEKQFEFTMFTPVLVQSCLKLSVLTSQFFRTLGVFIF